MTMISPPLHAIDSNVQSGHRRTIRQKEEASTVPTSTRTFHGKIDIPKKPLKPDLPRAQADSSRHFPVHPSAPSVDAPGFAEALELVNARLEGCSTGRPSCDSCKRGFHQDVAAMESAFLKCTPTLRVALQKAETVPNAPRLLASRAHASFYLRALATLQLKYAVQVYRSRVIDCDTSEFFLKQAGGEDSVGMFFSNQLHQDVQDHLFNNLDMFDELFETDFGLLRSLGIDPIDSPAWLHAHHIPHIYSPPTCHA
ncbi:hypothetical protein BKA70DRAFT_1431188 [Coprinopsis sp. MPI-PUGE-AT-0042]|nr:hypothetical protein BKA70DRAFT_1431188 [Coprinopsis sp. MPI-PUGE-AT-0042]